MILLLAVVLGILAGLLRAWSGSRPYRAPHLRWIWLVPIAFLPQYIAFYFPGTREAISDRTAAILLVSSQILLLGFAWANRKHPAFWVMGLGLTLNLLVILANGGLMPISPETVTRLAPQASPNSWQVGSRLGTTKDVVQPIEATRLWWLSDRFLLPSKFPYQVAFSLGDIFIAAGAFGFLWAMGGKPENELRRSNEDRDEHTITISSSA